MRMRIWLAGAGAGLLLASPAWAQTANTFGGVDPTKITNQVISIPDSATAIAGPQQSSSPGFSLANFLPSFKLPSGKGLFGMSIFPAQQNLPGKAYLQNFGYSKPQPISD
jgi:hypothetical protein